MGLKETLAVLTAAGEKERQRREDAPQKLLAWLKEIDDLYAWVKDNLSEHGSLRYDTKPIQLSEDQLGGKYEANILLISAGSEERPIVVALEPVGFFIHGSYRGDRYVPSSTEPGAKLVYIDQKIVRSRLAGTLEIVRNTRSFPGSHLKLSSTYCSKLRPAGCGHAPNPTSRRSC